MEKMIEEDKRSRPGLYSSFRGPNRGYNEGGLFFCCYFMFMYWQLPETGLGCDILIGNGQIGSKSKKESGQRYCESKKCFPYSSYFSSRVSAGEGPGEKEH